MLKEGGSTFTSERRVWRSRSIDRRDPGRPTAGRLRRGDIFVIFELIYRCLEAAGATEDPRRGSRLSFYRMAAAKYCRGPIKGVSQCNTPNWAAPASMSPGSALVA